MHSLKTKMISTYQLIVLDGMLPLLPHWREELAQMASEGLVRIRLVQLATSAAVAEQRRRERDARYAETSDAMKQMEAAACNFKDDTYRYILPVPIRRNGW